MKTPLTYGVYTAIASALLTLTLFLLGHHSDAAKMQSSQMVGTIVSFLILISGIVLGIRARRGEIPLHQPFGYGRALGAGILVGLFAALFSSLFHGLYVGLINPEFSTTVTELQRQSMEEKGMDSDAIEAAAKFSAILFNPGVQMLMAFIGGMFSSTIVSLISAAFLKRPAIAPEPPADLTV